MSSARTYDAALPLPSVFVEKMKSLNDCFNMAIQVYQIPAPAGEESMKKFSGVVSWWLVGLLVCWLVGG